MIRFVLALAFVLVSTTAQASPTPRDLAAIDRTAKEARDEGGYTFCSTPQKPLGTRQRELCGMARTLDHCEGLRAACDEIPKKDDARWLEGLLALLGPVAQVLLYGLALVIVVVVAVPIVAALRKRRRDRAIASRKELPNVAAPFEETTGPSTPTTDAEATLALADTLRARGELARATSLYLTASLVALDLRGALRLGRHRTNGEYVRACTDPDERPDLRAIVSAVDETEFGGAPPDGVRLADVARRAQAIVKRVTPIVAGLLTVFFVGCGPLGKGSDPAGDELPLEVLRRNGFHVAPLGRSLATIPILEPTSSAPVVIVDVEKVPLEDESRAHLMRWVESGGALVLVGGVSSWPRELGGASREAGTTSLEVHASDPNGGLEDLDDDVPSAPGAPIDVVGARTARADAFTWSSGDERVASLGSHGYAAKKVLGQGLILAIANDDLFTNVGVLPAHNAAALVTLVRSASHDLRRRASPEAGTTSLTELRIAGRMDGVPPPDNPLSALLAAGLGRGTWHAFGAALVLFLAYGIRHARPRREAEEKARRAFVEHVEATGSLYDRARSKTHALGAYGRYVELRIRELAPRGTDPITFLATRCGVTSARVNELLGRALATTHRATAKGDELEVLDELRTMMAKATKGPRASGAQRPRLR